MANNTGVVPRRDNRITTVLGVDPGGRETGLVVRAGGELRHHEILRRPKDQPLEAWCEANRARVRQLQTEHAPDLTAVEGLTVPNAHMGRGTKVLAAVMDTAAVFGAVVSAATAVVKPGKRGSKTRANYPPELWGPREGPKGTGRLRHCRSAWDVAGAAVPTD